MTNSFTLNPKYTIRIVNYLPQRSPYAEVHCKFGNDDLRIQTLKSGEGFQFSFHATADTLFYCNFHWDPKKLYF